MHSRKGKGRDKTINTLFNTRYIVRISYGMWVKLFRKELPLGSLWVCFEYLRIHLLLTLIGTPILLFTFNINKLSLIKYSTVSNICIHYAVIYLIIFNNCVVLWPMSSKLKSLTLLCNEYKDNTVCCWN